MVFFNRLNASVGDPRLPLEFLLDLRAHGLAPQPSEVNPYVAKLLSGGETGLAREAWRKLLPADRQPDGDLIYNERLLFPLSGSPLDWSFGGGKGVDVDIVDRPDKPHQRALDVQFGAGLTDPLIARQTLALPPGKYAFHGQFVGHINARRGVSWQVACLADQRALSESEPIFGAPSDWRDMSMTFLVPPSNCALQVLKLSLNQISDSDRIVSGRLWFSDLSVRPAK